MANPFTKDSVSTDATQPHTNKHDENQIKINKRHEKNMMKLAEITASVNAKFVNSKHTNCLTKCKKIEAVINAKYSKYLQQQIDQSLQITNYK